MIWFCRTKKAPDRRGPFSFDRFLSAVNKYVHANSLKEIQNSTDSPIIIKADKKLHKINPETILFIEAFGDYVKIHLENQFLLTNNTFKKIVSLFQNEQAIVESKVTPSASLSRERMGSILY